MRVRCIIAAAVALQAVEKIFFHDIEVLKHSAFRLGCVALLDRIQYLFVPAPGKLMACCAHVFDFRVVEEFPQSAYASDARREMEEAKKG